MPGALPGQSAQSLADTLRRASRWCDDICFGEDPAGKGASLAASLSVESAQIRIKGGQLRLICDYRPIVQVVGIAVGSGMSSLAALDPSSASLLTIGRRTIYIPYGSSLLVSRTGDTPSILPGSSYAGAVYAVWSYVNGYPHTKLTASVAADATSCVVSSTDGAGGLWGVFPASGAFPGTDLTIIDQGNTERVFVQSIAPNTPSTGQTTLTTTPFTYAHTPPPAPDFIPVSGVPEDVHQAVISIATALIKVRGTRAQVMSTTPGGKPSKSALAQAGALEDFEIAERILSNGYRVRVKHSGSY